MLSKRQRQLLRTLDEGPRSGSELARALGVSRRTVIREVASVSAWLESMGAGSIASDPNYHLVVTSDEALASLLSQDLSDEARVLLCVLRTPGVAIAQVAEETYLSPRAVRAAMAEANDRLQGIASLEARVGYGIDARFTGMEAPDLLAALAMDSSGVLAELERSCSVDSLMRMVGEKSDEYRLLMEPYLSQRQLRIQTLAAAYCCAWIVPDSTGVADARVRAVSLFQERKQRLLYRLITHRAAILARINEALSSHGIRPTREDLGSLIFDHVLRCALFPRSCLRRSRDRCAPCAWSIRLSLTSEATFPRASGSLTSTCMWSVTFFLSTCWRLSSTTPSGPSAFFWSAAVPLWRPSTRP